MLGYNGRTIWRRLNARTLLRQHMPLIQTHFRSFPGAFCGFCMKKNTDKGLCRGELSVSLRATLRYILIFWGGGGCFVPRTLWIGEMVRTANFNWELGRVNSLMGPACCMGVLCHVHRHGASDIRNCTRAQWAPPESPGTSPFPGESIRNARLLAKHRRGYIFLSANCTVQYDAHVWLRLSVCLSVCLRAKLTGSSCWFGVSRSVINTSFAFRGPGTSEEWSGVPAHRKSDQACRPFLPILFQDTKEHAHAWCHTHTLGFAFNSFDWNLMDSFTRLRYKLQQALPKQK